MGDSTAVQVVPGVYPVTVKPHGLPSLIVAFGGETVPLVQATPMSTDAALFGTKSLLTVNVATAWFTIVHEPVAMVAVQLDTRYPAGTPDSLAVQLVLGFAPVTRNEAGEPSAAGAVAGVGVPRVQESVMVTDAGLLSVKSLWTVNMVCAVFTIVQVTGTPSLTATLAQLV
jgi:hypothetical protein